ncbi:SDR family NAD(P)-dependent oxidoreductase [Opitutus sp. ER46]|uniref:SDR family NAD(P)-dependent oxidoreductase n=1 Tax=Opitutus sp. ER46 TaxID=2161864 RepID=UPI000D31BDE2|nr:SDR family NAD(P)-dependent oxidoreductase [Opitutus sp. ER46]PTX95672.1 3-oxoacyl-ACP reductase [Opitutus sp. ER46]
MTSRLHALVTGASRGIGRAIAEQLAARGCRVAVHYHQNRAAAESLLATLPGDGHACFAADLLRNDGAETLWTEVERGFGPVDLLVNNAGIYELHASLTTDHAAWREAWQRTLASNLLAPAHLCHLAALAMVSRAERTTPDAFGRGRIVNISSRGAFRGEPHAPAYGASKAGLNSLSQSLAKDLAPRGVFIFCLAPGWVETDMAAEHLTGPRRDEIYAQHPLGRVSRPDEIARAAVFCGLDAPAVMTGSIVDLNGASYLRT